MKTAAALPETVSRPGPGRPGTGPSGKVLRILPLALSATRHRMPLCAGPLRRIAVSAGQEAPRAVIRRELKRRRPLNGHSGEAQGRLVPSCPEDYRPSGRHRSPSEVTCRILPHSSLQRPSPAFSEVITCSFRQPPEEFIHPTQEFILGHASPGNQGGLPKSSCLKPPVRAPDGPHLVHGTEAE
jgi:hypothetical protein